MGASCIDSHNIDTNGSQGTSSYNDYVPWGKVEFCVCVRACVCVCVCDCVCLCLCLCICS